MGRPSSLKEALMRRKVKEKRGIGRPVTKWRDSVTVTGYNECFIGKPEGTDCH